MEHFSVNQIGKKFNIGCSQQMFNNNCNCIPTYIKVRVYGANKKNISIYFILYFSNAISTFGTGNTKCIKLTLVDIMFYVLLT